MFRYIVRRAWFSEDPIVVLRVPKNDQCGKYKESWRLLREVMNLLHQCLRCGQMSTLKKLKKALEQLRADEAEMRSIEAELNGPGHAFLPAPEQERLLVRHRELGAY